MVEVDTRYGKLTVPDKATDLIVRFLDRYGEWAWEEARFVANTLPGDSVRVLDAGAFIGTFGLGIALQRSVDFLCLIEANSALIPLLEENVARNHRGSFCVTEGILGWPAFAFHNGHCDPHNLGATSFVASADETPPSPAAQTVFQQRLVTLAELRAEHGNFDLIKLDLEGMELGVLKSDAEHLAHGETSIWVECREDPISLDIAALLLSWGLDLYYFAFPAYNPDNFRGDPTPILPLAYEAGLLAAPKAPPELDKEMLRHGCILRRVSHLDDLKDALWRTPRWGETAWIRSGTAEVVALAVHKLRGENYETYLGPDWKPKPLPDKGVWARLEETEAGLRRAEALAYERLDLLETEQERARNAEARMARACVEALDRLSELGVERDRAYDFEKRALAAERRAIEIETSTTWRLTSPIRRILDNCPRLRAVLLRTRGVASNLIRRWR
ncbi:FkbM family methyltransferase [Thiocapsa rosea]|uniref:FkbM family methyltransferase n=1 Tax=Thiocapsa rosea TaxID=69360 RepID=A0A495V9M3_9GAMM|nr:FkbM family methyltransferase [Thiocapsa rosea]RKT44488.1 FkbM family methyltransferase [Thiocapsa rosea]